MRPPDVGCCWFQRVPGIGRKMNGTTAARLTKRLEKELDLRQTSWNQTSPACMRAEFLLHFTTIYEEITPIPIGLHQTNCRLCSCCEFKGETGGVRQFLLRTTPAQDLLMLNMNQPAALLA